MKNWNRILIHTVLIFIMMLAVFGDVHPVSAQVVSIPIDSNLPGLIGIIQHQR